MLPSQHLRGSSVARAREDRPQGVNARGTSGSGTRVEPSNPRLARNMRPRLRRAQRAGRAELGARRARGGAGSPARSRAATTRRAAPRRPWPDRPALLHVTCHRPPPRRPPVALGQGPAGGGRHSRAERPGTTGGSSTGPRQLLLPVGRRPASCTSAAATAAPPLPGPSRGRGARRRRSLKSGRPGGRPAAPHPPQIRALPVPRVGPI